LKQAFDSIIAITVLLSNLKQLTTTTAITVTVTTIAIATVKYSAIDSMFNYYFSD
jgi:hypothetical protein